MALLVLHVAQPRAEGVPRSVGRLVVDQVERGFRVIVACPAASTVVPVATAAGAQHVAWEATREPGPSVVSETRRLAGSCARCNPTCSICTRPRPALPAAWRRAAGCRRSFSPVGWSFEAVTGPKRAAAAAWERFGARWAAAVVCVSEGERERGEGEGIHARWHVIANGVDLNVHEPADAADRAQSRQRLELGKAR